MLQLNLHRKNKFKKGFTLVEALVSTAVFAVALSSIIGSFLAVLRISAKSKAIRVVEQDARFVSELLVREIRNGSLSYSAYSGGTIASPTQTLHLVGSEGVAESIFLSGTSIALTKGGTTSNITSNKVLVSNMNFYIAPSTNPFCVGCPDVQPRITFTFTLTSNINTRPTDQAKTVIQSTVSSRSYPEKL
ncbi:MAG: hypothetical protein A2826_02850 [Candidatus Doudnabacteria bacterium RIFCSPHIGHO2_01_FULL_43_23]|uniref:Prepilin-type N-terminal cleavage/methylation domain-containing protein n=1 Tax=Candidatus Doudnabacteria bacterium RIFCSPHIGHO2_01_FULL_43_23 TaxID=1817822 RepID=A0A1F5NSN8_9BACT|nr:MAG: hypothetical protein A2826_02850 [Candidatus Doudnabacteria bacterium RIFCSPHIGHO2_01_FULL_43_23]